MNRELLEKPFEANQIKQRKGTYGGMLDYVETHAVIQRLNDAFDANWNFEIISHEVQDNEVIVLGKLTANDVVKMQFGSNKISVSKQGEVIGLGDDLKAASSDCLKKCATLLGVGLHLYGAEKSETDQNEKNDMSEKSKSKGSETVTKEQLNIIKELRTALGWTPKKVQDMAKQMFGTTEVEKLNPTMASAFIAYLQTQNGGNKDGGDKDANY